MALLEALQNLMRPQIEQATALNNNAVAPVQARVPQVRPIRTLPDISPQQNGFEPMQPGGARFVTEDNATFYDGQGFSPKPEEPWYKRAMNDPALMSRLAMGFNTMRLNPDQGLNAMLGDRIKTVGALARGEKSKNKTLVALQNMGMDPAEAELLGDNPELLKIAAAAMYKRRMGGDITAELQTFSDLTKGMSLEDQEKARRIKLGLDPRATSSQKIDLGTSWGIVNDGVLVGTIPKDIAGVKLAEAQGTATAEAQVQYPQLVDRLDESIGVIDRALKMPNFNDAFGVIASSTPTMVQETRDVEISIEQIQKGQFLAAIDQLRGLGALSNAEGAAATAAQTSLNLAMSPEAARAELARLKKIMETGKQRALGKTVVDPDFVPQYIKDYEAQKSGSASNTVTINGTKITPVN
jgi:hypothetical protein